MVKNLLPFLSMKCTYWHIILRVLSLSAFKRFCMATRIIKLQWVVSLSLPSLPDSSKSTSKLGKDIPHWEWSFMAALKVCAVSKRLIALIAATYSRQVHFQSVRSATANLHKKSIVFQYRCTTPSTRSYIKRWNVPGIQILELISPLCTSVYPDFQAWFAEYDSLLLILLQLWSDGRN